MDISSSCFAFTGAHGTGKTTLVEVLKNELCNRGVEAKFITNSSGARALKKAGHALNQSGNDFVQYVVQSTHVSHFANPGFIADRCVLDGTAYMLAAQPAVRKETNNVVLHLSKTFAPLYKKIFYIPIEFPLELDGVRDADIKYQKDIDALIKWQIDSFGLTNVEVVRGSLGERVDQVLSHIL